MRYKYQAGHESSSCIGRWGKSKKVLLVSFNKSKCTHKHHQRLQVSTFSKKSRRNDLIDNLQSLVNSIMASSIVGKLPKKRITFLWKFIIYRKIANVNMQCFKLFRQILWLIFNKKKNLQTYFETMVTLVYS